MFLWLAGGLEAETLGTGLDPHIEVGTLGTGNLTDVGCVTGVGILQGKDSAEALIVQTGVKGELEHVHFICQALALLHVHVPIVLQWKLSPMPIEHFYCCCIMDTFHEDSSLLFTL